VLVTGLIWLRMGTGRVLLLLWKWTVRFHKVLGNPSVTVQLAAYQARCNSMELVGLYNDAVCIWVYEVEWWYCWRIINQTTILLPTTGLHHRCHAWSELLHFICYVTRARVKFSLFICMLNTHAHSTVTWQCSTSGVCSRANNIWMNRLHIRDPPNVCICCSEQVVVIGS
jgi:hypothetical protein